MAEILIIGYGNVTRSDDAVGCCAAQQLAEHFRNDPEVEVVTAQQLTPEMADNISQCEFVVFLDASYGEEPGLIQRKNVLPHAAPSGFTHSFTPCVLLSAAQQLYGGAPEAIGITLAGWSFEIGNELSSGARQRLPELVRIAQQAVESYRAGSPVRIAKD